MPQVQLRIPEEAIKEIDGWVEEGKFRSRSDAVKTILAIYQERQRTMEFFKMLMGRSEESKKNPKIMVRLADLDV